MNVSEDINVSEDSISSCSLQTVSKDMNLAENLAQDRNLAEDVYL